MAIDIADLLVEQPDFVGDQGQGGQENGRQFGSEIREAGKDFGRADRDDVAELAKDRPNGVDPCRARLDEGRTQTMEEGNRMLLDRLDGHGPDSEPSRRPP